MSQRSYVDDDIFRREIERMQSSWHYAGLRQDLAEHNDWILVGVPGREIMVQNFHGELRAFTNTCSHRFNAIRSAPSGNGALTCPYHRWTFDAEGCPVGIPFRSQLATIDTAQLRLEAWEVASCGSFVFVRAGMRGELSLMDWLGTLAPRLEQISAWIGQPYGRFDLAVHANWKLVVQNTLEFDHVYSIHPQTFGALVDTPPTLVEVDMPLPHVGYRAALMPWNPTRNVEKKIEAILQRSPADPADVHEHHSIFPLTAVGVFRRMSISVLRYVPRSPTLTEIDTRLFFPKLDGATESELQLLSAYGTMALEFSKKLGNEDKQVCESVQRGVANRTGQRGLLGHGERIVRSFQEGYIAYMMPAAGVTY